MPEVFDFMLRPEVDSAVLHMVAFGMAATEDQGEALVQKATRIMSGTNKWHSNCSNRGGGHAHRHVHLIHGRTKQAQIYSRLFGERLGEGIVAQNRLDSLRVQSRRQGGR